MGKPLDSGARNSGPPRFRYLIDIIILFAAVFGLEAGAEIVYRPASIEGGYLFGLIIQMFEVGVAWLITRLRGEMLADIGLQRPRSWNRTFVIGVLLAAIFFGGIYLSEKAGFHRELSRFAALQGNLRLTIVFVFYVLIGAGFYEEFMYRGFLMQGLAMFLGGNRVAWGAALIVQAFIFGAAHAYQNPLGMLITGTIGLALGLLVILSGRNLWAAIIAHGLYDATRAIVFYFQGPPHS